MADFDLDLSGTVPVIPKPPPSQSVFAALPSREPAEELAQVVNEQIGHLHRREVAAAVELVRQARPLVEEGAER